MLGWLRQAIHLHVPVEFVGRREVALVGELDGVFHRGSCALDVGLEVVIGGEASFFQLRLEQLDGIAVGLPLRLFFARAAARRVGHRVATEAIADSLDQRRAIASAGGRRRRLPRLAHGQRIHAVHAQIGHAIGGGARLQRVHRPGLLDVHAHRVAVVLAEIDDGQLPQRGQVQRLVERAFIHRAIAKEGQRDIALLLILDAEAHAGGDDELRADDGLAAQQPMLGAVHVHRAALAATTAGHFAVQLCHDSAWLDTLGDGMPVLAIAAEDVIGRAQRGDGPHASRLLADVQVEEAADLAQGVGLASLLFELPDERHLVVQPEQLLAAQTCEGRLTNGHVS